MPQIVKKQLNEHERTISFKSVGTDAPIKYTLVT